MLDLSKEQETQLCGYLGAIFLIIGCFLPLHELSYQGSSSSIALINMPPFAIPVIVIGLISIGLIFKRVYKWLYATGAAAILVFIVLYEVESAASQRLLAINNETAQLAGKLLSNYSIAWTILLLAAILILITPVYYKGVMQTNTRK